MRQRILLGPLLILVLVGLFWLDEFLAETTAPEFLRPLLFGLTEFPRGSVLFPAGVLLGLMATRELAAMLRANGLGVSTRFMSFSCVLGLVASCLVPASTDPIQAVAMVATGAVVVLVGAMLAHSRNKTVEGVLAAACGALLAFVYLGLMFGFFLAIRREYSAWTVLWILLVTKSCDIGAYFTGKSIGRHKLIEWLSPGKTWEGLAGGVVFAAIVGAVGALILSRAVEPSLQWHHGVFAGVLFALTGQFGDLLASLFKRDAGMKDASKTLPGYGGILDLIDSPLLVGPVAFWWLYFTIGM